MYPYRQENTMRVTSKGQVAIPQQIRIRLGLLPQTRVEFELAGDPARFAKRRSGQVKAADVAWRSKFYAAPRVRAMGTDEILALTRGEPSVRKRRK
jgi:AbrB family looped-hinge helix DNA binding protein